MVVMNEAKRRTQWEKLGGPLDVLVVGGGITGAGIARDAASRGLRVALVEMNDLAYGTSSRSTKLVHGGLRYLEQGDIGLVFESVNERRVLMKMAPHLVTPLGFLFPVFVGAKRGLPLVNTGMWMYDALSLFRSPKLHKTVSAEELPIEEPCLRTEGVAGAPLYYDCATDDARLTVEVALAAVELGANVVTWARAEGFVHEGGRLVGAKVRCGLSGAVKDVRAKVVVNATGPWTDRTLAMGNARSPELLRPTKGIHIVVPYAKLPLGHAVLCAHPSDARVLFAIPWGDRTYVGTTDTDFEGDPADVAATAEDVRYLLEVARHYFPRHPIAEADVIATWAGLRPLLAPPSETVSESQVSREHSVLVREDGLVTIAGGKLTTFRLMAQEVVDEVVARLGVTALRRKDRDKRSRAPLPGARTLPRFADERALVERTIAASARRLDERAARHLVHTYGGRATEVAALAASDAALAEPIVANRPEVMAQLAFAIDRELAATVSDVMIRRTQLFFRDLDQGLGVTARVADFMASRLGWSAAETERHAEAYRAEVARSRRWRLGSS